MELLTHGVGNTGDSAGEFLRSGFLHMAGGWDHLLFIAGVLLLAREFERGVKLLSLFALGHSLTLVAATLAGWRVSAVAVDVVIALSLVFVGVAGWLGPPRRWRWFGATVLAIGLVHGLGLATRLQAPGLAEHVTLPRVLAFNLGVEMAQFLAAMWMVFLGLLINELAQPRWRTQTAGRLAHGTLVVLGMVAAVTLVTQALPATMAG